MGLTSHRHLHCEGFKNNIGSVAHKAPHSPPCELSGGGHTVADYAVLTQDTFRLGAAHVDETVAHSESVGTAQQRTHMVRSTVAGIDESMPFHGLLLEDALPSAEQSGEGPSMDQRHQLQELLMVSSPSCHSCDNVLFSTDALSWQEVMQFGGAAQEWPVAMDDLGRESVLAAGLDAVECRQWRTPQVGRT